MKKIFLTPLLILFIFMLSSCDAFERDVNHEIGETLSNANYAITLEDAYRVEETLFGELPSDMMWLQLEITLQNVGFDQKQIDGLLMFTITDDAGNVYDLDIFTEDAHTFDGALNQGERKLGTITFAVPIDSDYYIFIFNPEPFSPGATFRFEILKEHLVS
jgi:hypothetical protein